MMEYFDGTTKPTFRDPSTKAYIRFGGPRDTDANYGIKRGVLTLPGYVHVASTTHRYIQDKGADMHDYDRRSDIESFFQESLNAIKLGIDTQLTGIASNLTVRQVRSHASRTSDPTPRPSSSWAASPPAHTSTQSYRNTPQARACVCSIPTARRKFSLSTHRPFRGRTDDGFGSSKAVAEGALWFHLDNCVCARVARHTYGSGVNPWYQESDPEHVRRKAKTYTELNGIVAVPGGFATIVSKVRSGIMPLVCGGVLTTTFAAQGTSVHETKEFSFVYGSYYAKPENMTLSAAVMAYRGSVATPKWMDDEPSKFQRLRWKHTHGEYGGRLVLYALLGQGRAAAEFVAKVRRAEGRILGAELRRDHTGRADGDEGPDWLVGECECASEKSGTNCLTKT